MFSVSTLQVVCKGCTFWKHTLVKDSDFCSQNVVRLHIEAFIHEGHAYEILSCKICTDIKTIFVGGCKRY